MTQQPIATGSQLPNIVLKILGNDGLEDFDVADYCANKKVIIFGVPGAFTPACTQTHVPGFLTQADALKAQGIDTILCVHVNDPFVSQKWGESLNIGDKITLLPDGNADLTKSLGLTLDASGFGMGTRCQRFSMIVNKGVIESLDVEDDPTQVTVAGADACLVSLRKAA